MFNNLKHKKIIAALLILLLLGLGGYWFFYKTVRGNSLALYLAGGWHAPIGVRYNCAKETDAKVSEKFLKPLNFDRESKNLLKNFWYYSYYRGCLFKNGYDFSGNPVPKSLLTAATSEMVYENRYAGLNFFLPLNSEILSDNLLNVDLDDRLFVSEFNTPAGNIMLYYYTKSDDFQTLEDLGLKFQNIPQTLGKVIKKEIRATPSEISYIKADQDDGNIGLIFLTPEKHLIILFGQGPSVPTLESAINSFSQKK